MFYFEELKFNDGTVAKVLKSSLLEGVEHFFTTRDFVLSQGSKEDLQEIVLKNRKKLCDFFCVSNSQLHIPKQTHSDNVAIISSEANNLENTDGLVSNIKNSILLLNFADCTPIILYDRKKSVGAVVHAGWRGTAQKIVQKAVNTMQMVFQSELDDIVAAIGPAIGPCCYCTDSDVYYNIRGTVQCTNTTLFGEIEQELQKKYFIDLKKVNETQLREIGVKNVDVTDFCTSCKNDLFFSYRKEHGDTARHSAVLMI